MVTRRMKARESEGDGMKKEEDENGRIDTALNEVQVPASGITNANSDHLLQAVELNQVMVEKKTMNGNRTDSVDTFEKMNPMTTPMMDQRPQSPSNSVTAAVSPLLSNSQLHLLDRTILADHEFDHIRVLSCIVMDDLPMQCADITDCVKMISDESDAMTVAADEMVELNSPHVKSEQLEFDLATQTTPTERDHAHQRPHKMKQATKE